VLTVSKMRFWIMDRAPSDNLLEGDLFFTDAEYVEAMEHAARTFNSIPPFTVYADPQRLSDQTEIFFEATAEMLYKMKLHSLQRNAFAYSGGNVAVDEDNVKIQGLNKLIESVAGWRQMAKDIKTQTNVSGFYGSHG
jgi:hypothetical protein